MEIINLQHPIIFYIFFFCILSLTVFQLLNSNLKDEIEKHIPKQWSEASNSVGLPDPDDEKKKRLEMLKKVVIGTVVVIGLIVAGYLGIKYFGVGWSGSGSVSVSVSASESESVSVSVSLSGSGNVSVSESVSVSGSESGSGSVGESGSGSGSVGESGSGSFDGSLGVETREIVGTFYGYDGFPVEDFYALPQQVVNSIEILLISESAGNYYKKFKSN